MNIKVYKFSIWGDKMSYENLISTICAGSVIKFKEYNLDRHEHKRLVLSIDGAVVQECIPPNQALPKDLLFQYYGTELDDTAYLQLSSLNAFRVVIIVGTDEESKPIYQVLTISKDFYENGLQQIEIISEVSMIEPNYTSQINKIEGW